MPLTLSGSIDWTRPWAIQLAHLTGSRDFEPQIAVFNTNPRDRHRPQRLDVVEEPDRAASGVNYLTRERIDVVAQLTVDACDLQDTLRATIQATGRRLRDRPYSCL